MQIQILVATMTGTAQLVAQEIELTYADDETGIDVQLMDDLTPAVFEPGPVYLICTSTYGQGDVPDNGQALFDALQSNRPDLTGIRFGVLGLGDMTYADTFNYGGKRFEALLMELGATRIGDRAALDASSGELPEDDGVTWMQDWLELARDNTTEQQNC